MIFNISYTSLNFIFFVLATMLVYFLFPAKKHKWTVLLAASMFFYAVAGYKFAYFIVFTTLSTFLTALWIERVSLRSKKLLKEKNDKADSAFRSAVMREAAENVSAEIPAVMIDEKVEETLRNYASQFGMNDRKATVEDLCRMMGINDEIMEKNIRPGAEFQVKTDLLLKAVMDAEKLDDNDEAFAAYVERVSGEVGATADQLRQYFGEDFMRNEFRKELATNLIVDSAVAKPFEEKKEADAE